MNKCERLDAETHGGNRGLPEERNGGGQQLVSMGKHTTAHTDCQQLRGANGKIVAVIDGDCLKKQLDGSRHFMRKPAGIAFDAAILEAAERAAVQVVWVRDRETGDTFTCQLADFTGHAVKLDRGFGLQYCLPFTFWRIRRASEPVQLGLALAW